MFIVRWQDENGATGEGTPWLDRELADRYAAYARRLARGRRRLAVVPAGPVAGRAFPDDVPISGIRVPVSNNLPLFEGVNP